jgi:hypothetical protein
LAVIPLVSGGLNAERTVLETAPGVSLSTYKNFRVPPATNEFGPTFDFAKAGRNSPSGLGDSTARLRYDQAVVTDQCLKLNGSLVLILILVD